MRILTVFLYLSDVEEGGGTHFNIQNITVKPKMGRAVIWPSVLDRDPNRKDFRTDHEALPVIKGVKYAANGMCDLAFRCVNLFQNSGLVFALSPF